MVRFRQAFRWLPDPRADNARHDLLEVLCIALAAVSVWSGNRARTWPTSGNRRKGCCGSSLVWSTASRATTRSAGCSVCSSPTPSSAHSGASWPLLPRPTVSSLPEWWPSMAKPCAAPTNAVGRQHRCNWSTSSRWKRGSPWPNKRRPAATRRQEPSKFWSFFVSKAASSPPMRCIATAPLRRRCSSGAATTFWRSRPTADACSLRLRSSLRGRANAASPRGSTAPATIAAKRGARPSCAIPVLLLATTFPGVAAVGRVTSRRRMRGRQCRSPRSYATICCPNTCLPKRLVAHHPQPLGHREPACIGCSTSISREDANRARKDNAPENLAILRRLALNIVRSHPHPASLRRKIKRAGWDNAFLLAMLSHMR